MENERDERKSRSQNSGSSIPGEGTGELSEDN